MPHRGHEADHGDIEKIRDRLAGITRRLREHSGSAATLLPAETGVTCLNDTRELSLPEIHDKLRLISRHLQELGGQKAPEISSQRESVTATPPQRKDADGRPGVGLEPGTSRIVASRELTGRNVITRSQRNIFLPVPADTPARGFLEAPGMNSVSTQDSVCVLGNSALDLAAILEKNVHRTVKRGMLNPEERDAVIILGKFIGNVLGPARGGGEPCCFSIPAAPLNGDHDTIHHRNVLEGILKRLGYVPFPIDEGYDVNLSELEHREFTGIGVSCGAGLVNVCAAFKSMPVMSFSISKGGDWIDERTSSVLGMPICQVTRLKEGGVSVNYPIGREEEAIAVYYRHFIRTICEDLAKAFSSRTVGPKFEKPADIMFAGGSTLAAGFIDLVRAEMESVDLGFTAGDIERAHDPLTSVSRGALVGAIGAHSVQ